MDKILSSEVDMMSSGSKPSALQARKLADIVRAATRPRHYSAKTEETYVACIKRHISFLRKRLSRPTCLRVGCRRKDPTGRRHPNRPCLHATPVKKGTV